MANFSKLLIVIVIAEIFLILYLLGNSANIMEISEKNVSVEQAPNISESSGKEVSTFTPNMTVVMDPRRLNSSFNWKMKINSEGFRDEEWSRNWSGITIIVLGDSWTAGYGMNKSERYTHVLETKLENLSHRKIRILNMGIGAYTYPEKIRALKHVGLKYDPDMVIVQLLMDDFKSKKEVKKARSKLKEKYPEKNRSWISFKASGLINGRINNNKDFYLSNYLKRPTDKLSKMGEKHGFSTYGFYIDLDPENYYSPDKERVKSEYRDQRLNWADVGEEYKSLPIYQRRISANNRHPSVFGHRVIAETLKDEISDSNLLNNTTSSNKK